MKMVGRILERVTVFWESVSYKFYSILIQSNPSNIYNSKLQKMIAKNLNIPDIKFITFKNKNSSKNNQSQNKVPQSLLNALAQRNLTIQWLYRAQRTLQFSKSTLYLGIALLDKLLSKGMTLTDSNSELVGGTLALIVTKFNEVYPVTVKKLNALSNQLFSLDKYVETEASILNTVDFDISPEDPIYQELAELEHRLGDRSQEIIKTAVENPAVAFKQGSSILLAAIESMGSGGLMERKNDSRMPRETAELRSELQKLHSCSPNRNRMVSPTRV